jgi:hypothetical protein
MQVIETTDAALVPLSTVPDLPLENQSLEAGASTSGVLRMGNHVYIIGSSRSKGYREYEGLGWSAHILRPLF